MSLSRYTKHSYLKQLALFSALSCLPFALHAENERSNIDPNSTAKTEQITPAGKLPLQELRTFADVFNHIRLSHVEEVDDETLLKYAIQGMLEGLDPHSSYLNADSFDDLQVSTSGEFGGLGMEVGMENGFIKVITPMDDTPADKAGIEPGDLIIKLGDQPVKGLSLSEAVKLMRGPKGSVIELTVVREGVNNPFNMTLERDIIKVVSVRSKELEPGYEYIRIAQFQAKTGTEFRRLLTEASKREIPLNGLVIDLRNNPGGVLKSSVEVVDALLTDGLIVYTQGRIDNADSSHSASGTDLINNTPVVVLINGGSASASEIVAGALQDHHRAVIMGTNSFGKGSVQSVIPISEDRAIKLTTARYFTPKGRSIQAQGIAPDIVVERAKVEAIKSRKAITEADLKGHLKSGNGKESSSKERRDNQSDDIFTRDNQLYEALNLLKGLNILGLNTRQSSNVAKVPEDETAAGKSP
ncbi:MAG: carboxyl-terminal processing protease [Pseudohongiellaceae bacterium]|jgi:carboxyl-terminal processing protease